MAAQLNVLELTKQLVRMNTVNPPGQEEQCARHLGSLLESHGFSIAYHNLAPGRASLVATIGGLADKAHADTTADRPWMDDAWVLTGGGGECRNVVQQAAG